MSFGYPWPFNGFSQALGNTASPAPPSPTTWHSNTTSNMLPAQQGQVWPLQSMGGAQGLGPMPHQGWQFPPLLSVKDQLAGFTNEQLCAEIIRRKAAETP